MLRDDLKPLNFSYKPVPIKMTAVALLTKGNPKLEGCKKPDLYAFSGVRLHGPLKHDPVK